MKKYTYLEDGKTKADILTIDSPDDVTITNPVTGEVITWNGTEWVNVEIPPLTDVDGGTFT